MIIRILEEALRRKPRRVLAAVLSVMVGAALAAALLNLSLDLSGKMARELRSYGANILVQPETAAVQLEIGGVSIAPSSARGGIDENDLVMLKTIFWRNNIVGFAPFLSEFVEVGEARAVLTGTWFDKTLSLPQGYTVDSGTAKSQAGAAEDIFQTGVKTISPWWQVEGEWARDEDTEAAMVGAALARKLGLEVDESFSLRYGKRTQVLRISGLITTGGYEEEQIFVSLAMAQRLLGLTKGVDRVLVSALIEPDSALRSDLRGIDPSEMTPEQYAIWYCSPIISAVITQIKEVLPGMEVKPIRQITDAEGAFLKKMSLLMILLSIAALSAAVMAVMTAMTASILERRTEIGLLKSIGADSGQVALLFLSEAGLIGLAGGLAGYMAGLGFAAFIGRQVFSTAVSPQPVLLPVTLVLGLGVALTGSALPVRKALRLDPVILLKR
ncbi:MAG: FtsX-like permease family protein [Spirochaetota bacterium]